MLYMSFILVKGKAVKNANVKMLKIVTVVIVCVN